MLASSSRRSDFFLPKNTMSRTHVAGEHGRACDFRRLLATTGRDGTHTDTRSDHDAEGRARAYVDGRRRACNDWRRAGREIRNNRSRGPRVCLRRNRCADTCKRGRACVRACLLLRSGACACGCALVTFAVRRDRCCVRGGGRRNFRVHSERAPTRSTRSAAETGGRTHALTMRLRS